MLVSLNSFEMNLVIKIGIQTQLQQSSVLNTD